MNRLVLTSLLALAFATGPASVSAQVDNQVVDALTEVINEVHKEQLRENADGANYRGLRIALEQSNVFAGHRGTGGAPGWTPAFVDILRHRATERGVPAVDRCPSDCRLKGRRDWVLQIGPPTSIGVGRVRVVAYASGATDARYAWVSGTQYDLQNLDGRWAITDKQPVYHARLRFITPANN